MLLKQDKFKKGFTLIELLVAIAIIGIMSATILVSLGGARQRARLSSAQSQLRALHPQLIICINDDSTLTVETPLREGGTSFCGLTGVTFPELPSNWTYSVNTSDTYGASTTEGDAWSVSCSETGCVTTP
ncbi:MAG: type II secretion system protein [Candidatus Pacebacteria bacterium]|nr:type II secretion system protein [Candidatus Paceibacterota bacterium]